jgi:hypothetical protein
MAHSAAHYRERAEHCLRLAEKMLQPENKAALIEIARAWYSLAEWYERKEEQGP